MLDLRQSPICAAGRSFENVLCEDSTENVISIPYDANQNPTDKHDLEPGEVEPHIKVVIENDHIKFTIMKTIFCLEVIPK